MKCDIIKDLLPSYIDGLTSEASNELIREHLESCSECRSYYEEMKREITAPEIVARNKKEIRPFRKWKRRIWKAVGITAAVCVLVFGGWMYHFEKTWLVDSRDVTFEYEKNGEVVTLKIIPKNEKVHLSGAFYDNKEFEADIQAQWDNPLNRPLQKNAYVGYTYVDEDTILTRSGEEMDLDEDDCFEIRFADRTVKVNLQAFGNEETWRQAFDPAIVK